MPFGKLTGDVIFLRNKVRAGLICLTVIVIFSETLSYFAMLYLSWKNIVYSPPRVAVNEYQRYLQTRDEAVGWPSPISFIGSNYFDKTGSIIVPSFPDPDKDASYISVYGDSFTAGDDVRKEYSYSNVLARLLNRRVANYGVGGYGTDQAFIRFLNNTNDMSEIVIIGYTTENILRNVNRYRPLLYCSGNIKQAFGFKPRFIVSEDGNLVLIPLLKLKYEDFLRVTRYPERYLDHEYFIPAGQAGVYKNNFPFSLNLLYTLTRNFHIRARLKNMPYYKDFYDPRHPSNSLNITGAIIRDFYSKALERNKRPIVLIIPTGQDFLYYNKHREWPYKNMVAVLKGYDMAIIEAGPYMISQLKGASPDTIFRDIHGHYNENGYRLLAEAVYRYLNDQKLMPKP